MENLITNSNIVLKNNPVTTFICSATGGSSSLDLTFCSPNKATLYDWDCLDDTYGSDHYPITLTASQCTHNNEIKKIHFKRANWEIYESNFIVPEITPGDINKTFRDFTKAMKTATEVSIPLSSLDLKKPPVPWRTDDCKAAIKIERLLLIY